MLRSTLLVTALIVVGQAVQVLVLIATAGLFGTTLAMDAFLAAMTLPQYVIAVVVNALGFVLIPVFVQYKAAGRDEEAWKVASGVINLCFLMLVFFALIGTLLSRPLLRVTVPGLEPEVLDMATRVAMITWPMIIPIGAYSLLAGIWGST